MIWGGDKLAALKGTGPSQERIGESWELSGFPEHQTPVAGGSFSGIALNDLLPFFGDEILGPRLSERFPDKFPLLVKFIHAAQDLSIQVHPDDEMAQRIHGENGKTEMWYVVDAEPGASLYCGFKDSVTPQEFETLVRENRITKVLSGYEVKKGDVFFLPAGRIHAICSGCLLAEIQQTSDLTYRIYDYGRKGADGKHRDLHIGLAKEALDYTVQPDYRTSYELSPDTENVLVRCPQFTTSLYSLSKPLKKDISKLDSFLILICTEGAAQIVTDEGSASLKKGETLLVSCSSRSLQIRPAGDGTADEGTFATLLTCYM